MAGTVVVLLGLMTALLPDVSCVEILSMAVPAVVEAGSDDIVLDCDFDYTEEEKTQLDIKWYFNNEPEPIYMWLPAHKGPQSRSEKFRDHLDLEYEVNQDSFTKHRALYIKNPLPQFSGTYKCKVSTFLDEDFDQKDLLVYAPPSSIKIEEISFSEEDPLNVTCVASGMYPLPAAKLTWGHNSAEHETTSAVTSVRDDGLVDVKLSTTIDNDQLAVQLNIGCQISLPGTEFTVQEQTIFYPKGMQPPTTTMRPPTTEVPDTTTAPDTTTTPVVDVVESVETGSAEPCDGSGDCDEDVDEFTTVDEDFGEGGDTGGSTSVRAALSLTILVLVCDSFLQMIADLASLGSGSW